MLFIQPLIVSDELDDAIEFGNLLTPTLYLVVACAAFVVVLMTGEFHEEAVLLTAVECTCALPVAFSQVRFCTCGLYSNQILLIPLSVLFFIASLLAGIREVALGVCLGAPDVWISPQLLLLAWT